MQIFNQYLLNKKDDTCPLLDTNISAWIELSQGVKGVMKLGLDVKIRIHAGLSNTSYMRLHSWTEEGCAAANFSHYILMTETKTSSAQRIHYMIKKYFHAPWNFSNEYTSLVVIFVLLNFVFIWDESVTSCFHQKYQTSFHSHDKKNCLVTTLYEVFNRLQAFRFFFVRGNQKKTHFALFGSRSEHRFSCSLAGPTTT